MELVWIAAGDLPVALFVERVELELLSSTATHLDNPIHIQDAVIQSSSIKLYL